MKLQAFLIACASMLLASPMTALADEIGVSFTETINGPGLDTLTVNVHGAVVTGSADDWFIDLSVLGIALSSEDLPEVFQSPLLGGYNVESIYNSHTLQLQAGVANPGTSNDYCGTGSPLPDGATCYIGSSSSNDYFATVVQRAPVASVTPEPSSFLLLGTGLLAAIGAARRRCR